MPSDPARLQGIWNLIEKGEFDLLQKLIPDDFDWNSCCPNTGFTACHAITKTFLEANPTQHAVLNRMVKYMIICGADPLQVSVSCKIFFQVTIEQFKIKVAYENNNTIDVVLDLQSELGRLENKVRDPLQITVVQHLMKRCKDLIEAFTSDLQGRQATFARTTVAESAVSRWETILNDRDSADLVLNCSDGRRVDAHTWMLKHLSPVLAAMLTANMQECKTKSINLHDSDEASVKLFLEASYCGCIEDKQRAWKVILGCLDIAHRWRVECVTSMMEQQLAKQAGEDSFEALCEAACLKNLRALGVVLKRFGHENKAIVGKAKRGELAAACYDHGYVERCKDKLDSQPTKKRRRVA